MAGVEQASHLFSPAALNLWRVRVWSGERWNGGMAEVLGLEMVVVVVDRWRFTCAGGYVRTVWEDG